jgi:hypothetical protein
MAKNKEGSCLILVAEMMEITKRIPEKRRVKVGTGRKKIPMSDIYFSLI